MPGDIVARDGRLRVVVVTETDSTRDARVRDLARSCRHAGFDAVILGPAPAHEVAISWEDGGFLVQVPASGSGPTPRPGGKTVRPARSGDSERRWRDRLTVVSARLRRARKAFSERGRALKEGSIGPPVSRAPRRIAALAFFALARGLGVMERVGYRVRDAVSDRRVARGRRPKTIFGAEADRMVAALARTLAELSPDVVIVSGPRALGVVHRVTNVTPEWFYDMRRDSMLDPLVAASRLAEDAEERSLPSGGRLIVTSPGLRDRLVQSSPDRPEVLVLPDVPAVSAADRFPHRDVRTLGDLPADVPVAVCLEPLGGSGRRADARAVRELVRIAHHLDGVTVVAGVRSYAPGVRRAIVRAARRRGCANRIVTVSDVGSEGRGALIATADVAFLLPNGPAVARGEVRPLLDALARGVAVTVPEPLADAVPQGEPIESPGGAPEVAQAILRHVTGPRRPVPSLDPVQSWETWAPTFTRELRRLTAGRTPRQLSRPIGVAALLTRPFPRPDANQGTSDGAFGLGPRNGNGMAWAWGCSVAQAYPDTEVEVFGVQFHTRSLQLAHPSHRTIAVADWLSREWQRPWERLVLDRFSHLLIEQALSVLGRKYGRYFFDDLPVLRSAGIEIGLVFRGSELRDPARHAEREPWSPFRDADDPFTRRLQEEVDFVRPHIDDFDGPTFVTTLDLLDDLPDATWLPHVLDVDVWAGGDEIMTRDRPVVVHAPSRAAIKGSADIDAVCTRLSDAGTIEYRRIRNVPFFEMPDTLRGADIVIDQMPLGSYGVLAAQAMAAGRLVVGHVSDAVRARVPGGVPIVEATPDTLEDVIASLADDRDAASSAAARGQEYVRQYHDGRYAAAVLACFLGLPASGTSGRSEEIRSR